MAITNINEQNQSTECLICGSELVFTASLDIGELLECYDCGTELEVQSVSPTLVLIEAPTEAEDWGQ